MASPVVDAFRGYLLVGLFHMSLVGSLHVVHQTLLFLFYLIFQIFLGFMAFSFFLFSSVFLILGFFCLLGVQVRCALMWNPGVLHARAHVCFCVEHMCPSRGCTSVLHSHLEHRCASWGSTGVLHRVWDAKVSLFGNHICASLAVVQASLTWEHELVQS